MSNHYQKPTPTTGAHSGDDVKAVKILNILKKDQEENQPEDTTPLYVKVTLSVLSVIVFILFILVIILMASVFGSRAELKKPSNSDLVSPGVVVSEVPVPVAVPSPTPGGGQGAAGVGEVYPAPGHGTQTPVLAHVFMNSTRLRLDRDSVNPMSIHGGMSSCEMGYEVRHSGLVQGVGFNATTSRLQVKEPGYYYIYSQVVFDKVPVRMAGQPFSDSLFHVLCKWQRSAGRQDRDLLQATESPNRARCDVTPCTHVAFHTSHVAGIVRLDVGDEVYVKVSDLNTVYMTGNSRGSFLGLHKI